MYRWSACAGSVREAAKNHTPLLSSPYAEEGTDAHALASLCLIKGHNPGYYIGKDISPEGRRFQVDKEMADAVQVYVDAIEERYAERAGDILVVEQKFDLSAVYPGCFGTADCVIWSPSKKRLTVADYKHGAGIPVGVKNNPQLRYYGLGALIAGGHKPDVIELVIVQPRCDHADGPVRSEEIDALDLLDFRTDLVDYAKATEDPNAPLVPGPHCRFCPAARECPAVAARAQEVARLEFKPGLPYDPMKLKLALDSRPILQAAIKAVDEFAYAEAEAGRLPKEVGYKLVDKRATRKWANEGGAIDYLQLNYRDNVLREAFEPRSLKSPAQLEKVTGIKKGDFDTFMSKESSGKVLVPASDNRPEAAPSTPQQAFSPAVVEATASDTDPFDIPGFLKR
jgi:hypothetical protein